MTNLIHLIIDGNAVEICVPEGAQVVIRTNVKVRLELATPEKPRVLAEPKSVLGEDFGVWCEDCRDYH